MKKTMTLAEAREMYGETVYETETGFLVNKFGKYRPNITFVIPKTFDLGKDGKVIDPLSYTADRDVTDNMNVNFDGDVSFVFGDFWRSKKGGACFRSKNPMQAKHLLICISWGGCFNSHRGMSTNYANECGALYFRSASSNGGGVGNDYIVLPVGYKHSCYDPEFDGEATESPDNGNEARAKVYRKKHADLQRAKVEEADKFLKEKAAAEAESRQAKSGLMGRLEAVSGRLALLGDFFGEKTFEMYDSYFKLSYVQYLYTEENVQKAEQWIADQEQRVADTKAAWAARDAAKAEFEPKFLALEARFIEIGWRMETVSSEKAKVFEPYERYWNYHTYHEESTHEFSYSEDGLKSCIAMLESKETEIREKREAEEAADRLKKAQEEAKALGLPSNIQIWNRSGATNAGQGYVIMPNGMDRPRDGITGNSRRIQRYDEGYEVWDQIMLGELVLEWRHAYTAAPHEFYVIYRPETITEAQLERVAEIQNDIEEQFLGKAGLASARSCPSIGQGWGLFHREESVIVEDDEEGSDEQPSGSGATLGDLFGDIFGKLKV